jgi:ribosome-associated toxin RatA of RatAB toxin-antitoxin module
MFAVKYGFWLLAAAHGASPQQPHPHQGVLRKYERLPPKDIGLPKIDVPKEQLRNGEPLLKKMNLPGGWTRSVSVQDVHADEDTVWSAINDLPRYPKMIDGVVGCEVYSKKKEKGCDVTCATYQLKQMGFSLKYYMKHFFEPKKHSMTFHLDYDRCSDVDDAVGYWYVEDQGDGWCRVYYSADTALPNFIPKFAKDAIIKIGVKRSTSWVNTRCNEVTGSGGGGKKKGAFFGRRKQMATLLALLAFQQGVIPNPFPGLAEKVPLVEKLPKLPLDKIPKLLKLDKIAKVLRRESDSGDEKK